MLKKRRRQRPPTTLLHLPKGRAITDTVSSWINSKQRSNSNCVTLVFLLFEEPYGGVKIPTDAPESDEKDRKGWDAIKFADKYDLKLVGANYFMTEVPKES